jgi:exopolysaccharide biosynthesis polyprenyl glycosylphosphotransferase
MATSGKPAFDPRQLSDAARLHKLNARAEKSLHTVPLTSGSRYFVSIKDEQYVGMLALDVLILFTNALIFSALPSYLASFGHVGILHVGQRELLSFCLLAFVILATLLNATDLYHASCYSGLTPQCQRIVISALLTATVLLGFAMLISTNLQEAWIASAACVADIGCLSAWRYAFYTSRKQAATEKLPAARRVALIGKYAWDVALRLKRYPQLGYIVSAILEESELPPTPLLAKEHLDRLLYREFIDDLFICSVDPKMLQCLHSYSARRTVRVHLVADIRELLAVHAPLQWIAGIPVLTLNGGYRDQVYLLIKRVIDILGASIAIVALSPVMLLIAAIVKLTSKGPVFYRCKRVGAKGTTFSFLKFRTMVDGADRQWHALRARNERNGPFFKMADDPRITHVGGFLRKYSLDELPQLFNVLRGEMSLVGPRPPLPQEICEYKVEELGRLHIKPGITGLWQVTARRDPSFERNVQLDLLYIETWSPWSDLMILLKTIPIVFAGTGQ